MTYDAQMPPQKGPGRPPRAGKVAEERIEIRATRLERRSWERAARQAAVSLSEWLRRLANRSAGPK